MLDKYGKILVLRNGVLYYAKRNSKQIHEHEALGGGSVRRLYCRLTSLSRSLQTILRINLDGTKMKAEQDKYRDWLLHQEPSEILNHTYEYTMREDIVMCMEELELEPEKARAFIGNDVDLLRNTLYQDQYIYMAV